MQNKESSSRNAVPSSAFVFGQAVRLSLKNPIVLRGAVAHALAWSSFHYQSEGLRVGALKAAQ